MNLRLGALGLCAALAACARATHADGPPGASLAPSPASSADANATIATLGFDAKTAGLNRIAVSLPNSSRVGSNASGFDYVVSLGDRDASFWSAKPAVPDPADPQRVLVSLTPSERAVLPAIGAHFRIKAVDRATGDELELASGIVAKHTGDFVNPGLATFVRVPGAGVVPAGWGPSGTAIERGTIAKSTDDGVTGAAIGLVAPKPGWNSFGLAQNVPLRDAEAFTVRVRPTHDCDGDSVAPTLVSGVALSDSVGHLAQFCISSKVKAPKVSQFSDGRQLIAVFPGRLNAWNDLPVDMRAMQSLFRLYPAKAGIVVTLGIALHADANKPASDRITFSDISVR